MSDATPASEGIASLVDDLEAEQAALEMIVSGLTSPTWDTPSPAAGWTVRDQISHLAFFDEAAALAIVDPGRFAGDVAAAQADRGRYEETYIDRGRAMTPAGVLGWWVEARRLLGQAARSLAPKARVQWYGPPMSAVSFVTARLMEAWSHGQDVVDALGAEGAPTDRLRHVAFLGARTRRHSYLVRGLEPPSTPVWVELVLPSGTPWLDGDESAGDRISGAAVDFCLVVTQRRHVADTDLAVRGPAAAEWMSIAQAFAGPPGPGRRPGQFRKAGKSMA